MGENVHGHLHHEDFMTKDVKRVILKFRLLHEISMKPSYSYELFDGMCNQAAASKFFGRTRSEIKNNIYNTIAALEKSGYIETVSKIEGGKLKNYCYITPLGKKTLKRSKTFFLRSIRELSRMVS
ncbi:MAG: PadR family transcriptional regulator [Candidatus Micrarchaeota archaeon]|nr:PadR family transcriptional regulator [Candidatus Micrarchaeota archaeon]